MFRPLFRDHGAEARAGLCHACGDGGRSGLSGAIPASCPYCGGPPGGAAYPYATHWQGRSFTYRDCRGCGATFIDPLPAPDELDRLFDRSAYHEVYYADPEPSPNQRDSLAWMRPLLPPGARLLDFGCGNGAFLKAAAEAGFRASGIEQNPGSIAFARQCCGLEVSSLEAVIPGGERFDAIHIADVLSHLPQPALLLRSLETLLAPGGLLVIEGPLEKQRNLVFLALLAGKRLQRLLGRSGEGEHAPVHLTFSSWKSQARFFGEVMRYEQLALDLHEDGWPFLSPGRRSGRRARQWIARAAIALSKSRLARPLGACNRFRVVLRPVSAAGVSALR